MRPVLAMCALLALSACQTTPASSVDLATETPAQASLRQSECALYYAVNAARVDNRQPVIESLTRGCPAGTDAIAADIRPRPGVQLSSPSATQIKRRMAARGMPQATLVGISTSKAFEELVNESAAL